MKKLIIIMCAMFLLTGCGVSNEEKENMFYNSLETAYKASYVTDGIGLAVRGSDSMEIDGKMWYLVEENDYDNVSKLEELAEVYGSKIKDEIKNSIKSNYRDVNDEMYALSEGGCDLGYMLDDKLQENLKKDVKIKKYGFMNKITFEYKGKEYTAKKDGDKYIFSEKIFVCENQGE